MRSNSGNKVNFACTIGSAIVDGATGRGRWSGLLLSAWLLVSALLVPLRADDLDVKRTLKGIEDRYNHAQSLQVAFTETYAHQGRCSWLMGSSSTYTLQTRIAPRR